MTLLYEHGHEKVAREHQPEQKKLEHENKKNKNNITTS
jgi:hypothetical protein